MRQLLARHLKFVITTAVALAAVIGIGAYVVVTGVSRREQQTTAQYREATVTRGDIREMVSATGPVAANHKTNLAFLLSGAIQQINVTEGQRVAKNDLLMKLDTSKLELDLTNAQLTVQLQQIAYNQLVGGKSKYDVAAARAAVARSAAQLAQLTQAPDEDTVRLAQQNYEQAQNNLWQIQASRDQIVKAFQLGISPQHQVDEANKDVESAEIAVKIAAEQVLNAQQGVSSQDIASARATLAQSQASLNRLLEAPTAADIELARVQIEQADVAVDNARLSIRNAQLLAPFAGVVAQINFQLGEQAGPGQAALVLLDDSAYHVDMMVDEVDIARVAEDQLAFIKLDAAPNAKITGHVGRIAPDGVTVRGVMSYAVRVEIDSADVPLKDGMTATIDIVVSQVTNVLLVPNWAIRFDKKTGDAYVNIRRPNGTIEEIKVVIGQRGELQSEVQQGLKEGDIVVVSLEPENPFGSQGQSQQQGQQ